MHAEHDHHHIDMEHTNKAFVWGIIINLIFVAVEAGIGWFYNSLALLADAGHNLTDVASLFIALFAFKLAQKKETVIYTYGYKKATILAALANSIILIAVIILIIKEAVERINAPQEINGSVIMIVAGIGIAVNFLTALLFFKNKEKDLNVKSAYLHLVADAAVSVGVVASGFLITKTGLGIVDPIASIIVALVIFGSAFALLKQTLRISLDGVPHNIEPEKIVEEIKSVIGVKDIHHLHIWALSTMQNALTVHVVLKENVDLCDICKIKSEIRHKALHLGIQHCTLETELETDECEHQGN